MDKFPFFRQLDAMDCGPTCLQMIAEFYGKHYSLQTLRKKCFITREGVSMLGICDAAESIGFQTDGIKVTLQALANEQLFPCILHWNKNHFVVCYKIKKSNNNNFPIFKIYIADPASGKHVLSQNDFLKYWTGITNAEDTNTGTVLFLQPTTEFYNNFDETTTNVKKLVFFMRYLKPHKPQLLQLGIGMGIGSILQLIFPFLTQAMVDKGIGYGNLNFITLVLITQLVLFLTQLGIEFIRNWITLHMNTKINIVLISDFLAKLLSLPLSYFDTKKVGDIMQRIGDHQRIESLLTGTSLYTLFSLFNFTIFALILGYYNLYILLIFALGNILNILNILFFMKFRRELDYKRFAQASTEQSNLIQLITGIQEIKLNNNEIPQRWKWEKIQVQLFKIGIKGMALSQYQQIASFFWTQLTSLIITFMAAQSVINGSMTLGMMMSIGYIIGQLSAPIGQIIEVMRATQDAKISLERLNEIHNQKDEEEDIESKIDNLSNDKTISIKNISFSYTGSARDYVFKHLSFTIPAGKVTAIVGTSGSGKTTLIKLLMGFYKVNEGSIEIGNYNLNDINPHLWREKAGCVMQDGFIFSETIAKNIAVGVEEIDRTRLLHAARMANILDYIESLPLQFESMIGMEGNGLSQGQKQRILIARAIYKNPDFLFLDEATNALDANNEKGIIENLNEVYKGKTVLIVAHRLSTVQCADKIIVISEQGICEEGSHHELIEKKGIYYYLIKNQL